MKYLLTYWLFFIVPAVITGTHLTLEEKVGQLLIVHFNGEECNPDATRLIHDAHVGGFIYYNWSNRLSSPPQVKNLSHQLQEEATIPLFIAVDQEGGRVTRLKEGFTQFPSNGEVGKTGDPSIAEHNAFVTGQELKQVGINMNLAPVVDVNVNPQNPVIGDRSFGSDPQTVIAFASQALEGYKRAGVLCVMKHFPGHGDVTVDPHKDLPIVDKPIYSLEKVELAPFAALNAPAIMTAHILVPTLDPDNPATTSKAILTDLLRNKIGYDGVIMSDSLVMEGLLKQYSSIEEAAIAAINAGCDVLILGGKQLLANHEGYELDVDDVIRIHKALVNAAKLGKIDIDESVNRILKLKESL